jgi:hypothetical protein
MSKVSVVALAAALFVAPLSVHAGDKEVKETKVKTEEKYKEKSVKSDDRGGFTGFWIHSVGGTIGNGLKGGANKISKAF